MWFKKFWRDLRSPPVERTSLDAAQLEDRVMMSASPLGAAVADAEAPDEGGVAVVEQVTVASQDSSDSSNPEVTSEGGASGPHLGDDQEFRFQATDDIQELRRELIVIDASAQN
jgi:hypothetical protein